MKRIVYKKGNERRKQRFDFRLWWLECSNVRCRSTCKLQMQLLGKRFMVRRKLNVGISSLLLLLLAAAYAECRAVGKILMQMQVSRGVKRKRMQK